MVRHTVTSHSNRLVIPREELALEEEVAEGTEQSESDGEYVEGVRVETETASTSHDIGGAETQAKSMVPGARETPLQTLAMAMGALHASLQLAAAKTSPPY